MSTVAAGSIAMPLDENQAATLREAVNGLSPTQLHWASGYIAGLAAADAAPADVVAAPDNTLTILYGSQTGNGQGIAETMAKNAREQGFSASLVSLAEYKPTTLKRESLVMFVVSTHGEGDPPDDAELFYEYILSSKAPKLPKLRFSVLALGDSSYINFCQTGLEIDQRLAELGAERLNALFECDLDYEDAAAAWSQNIIAKLPDLVQAATPVAHLRAVEPAAQFGKHTPFAAEVLVNQKITGRGSSKDVRHIELSLEGSGLSYEPGDSLAVVVDNPPQLVAEFIDELGFEADALVSVRDEETTIAEALRRKLEITVATLGFLRRWAEFSDSAELNDLLEAGQQDALSAFIETHQIIDVVRKYPAEVGVGEFLSSLRKLSPRSYSIASSLRANPDEVHLTVAAVRYEAFGTPHWGAASTHIADRIAEGDTVSVYVEPNTRFRLPTDDKPIIMIGPGTGVAPFRAFVEERAEREASGKNWLFFGDRTFSDDFLYQLEWQRHLKNGRLERLDGAFSRDQEDKVYVQQRLLENGAELFAWLEEGATIYVCGDAKHMAGDVHDALIEVLSTHAAITTEAAEQQLKELRRAGRYQRDVY